MHLAHIKPTSASIKHGMNTSASCPAAGGIDQSYSARTPAEVIRLFTEGKENARSYLRAQKALAEEAGLGKALQKGSLLERHRT